MTQPPTTPNYSRPQPGSGIAVAAMILGILSVVGFCSRFVAVPLGILAIVLAAIALSQIGQGRASGGGMARAGLILGIIGVVLSIVVHIVLVAGTNKAKNFLEQKSEEIKKQAEEQQRKIQEEQQQQQQNSTTQPGASSIMPPRHGQWDSRGGSGGRESNGVIV